VVVESDRNVALTRLLVSGVGAGVMTGSARLQVAKRRIVRRGSCMVIGMVGVCVCSSLMCVVYGERWYGCWAALVVEVENSGFGGKN
jgi:hypothetical protein